MVSNPVFLRVAGLNGGRWMPPWSNRSRRHKGQCRRRCSRWLVDWLVAWVAGGVPGGLFLARAVGPELLLSFAVLGFRRRRRSVNASRRLVWLDDVGVSWLLFGCLGGVAATAARVGSRRFSGNPGYCRMEFVFKWCVSGVLRSTRVKHCGSGS